MVRVQVHNQERIDAGDINLTNDFALDNLQKLIRSSFVGPLGTDGVIRGYVLQPTDPPGMAVSIGPGIAVVSGYPLAWEGGAQILNVPAAHPSQPRIDLVSLGFTEADDTPQERRFINELSEEEYPQTVPTRKVITPTFLLTQGAAAGSPAPPVTPAGRLALWTVRVDAGVTTILASKLSRVGDPPIVGSDRLKVTAFPGAGLLPVSLGPGTPYDMTAIGGTIVQPAATLSFFFAQVYVIMSGSFSSTDMKRALEMRLTSVATGAIIGRCRRQMFQGEEATLTLMGYRVGSAQADLLKLSLTTPATAGDSAITAVQLPVDYVPAAPGADVVSNLIAVVSA